jgi:hypothetical protein
MGTIIADRPAACTAACLDALARSCAAVGLEVLALPYAARLDALTLPYVSFL